MVVVTPSLTTTGEQAKLAHEWLNCTGVAPPTNTVKVQSTGGYMQDKETAVKRHFKEPRGHIRYGCKIYGNICSP